MINDKHSILNYKRTMLNDRIVLNNPCKLKLYIENCKLSIEYCLLNIYKQGQQEPHRTKLRADIS